MGTKHNYTEKECKVCGQVKTREEFPAYGGLTCRVCMREKERAGSKQRYQQNKRSPKWVEENRRRSREYTRKKRQEAREQKEREEQNVPDPPGDDYEEYERAWENADAEEIMDGLEDDALIDSIAQGVSPDETPDGLARTLAELRDAVDATNIPVKNTAKVERGENVLPPKNEGTSQNMSAQEEAARLLSIAEDTSAIGAAQQLLQVLEDAQTNVMNTLGSGHSRAGDAVGPFQTAIQQAQELQNVVHAAYANLNDIAGQIG